MTLANRTPLWTAVTFASSTLALTRDVLAQSDFNTEVEDDDAMFDAGGDSTRLTVNTDGIYLLAARGTVAQGGGTVDTSRRDEIRVYDSADVLKYRAVDDQHTSFDAQCHAKGVFPLVAGDYIELWHYHNDPSYSPRNLTFSRLDALRLGAVPGPADPSVVVDAEGARAQDSAGTLTTGYTQKIIAHATELRDDDNMWDAGNTGRLTVQTAGVYIVTGAMRTDRFAATDLDELLFLYHRDSGDAAKDSFVTRHRPEYGGGGSMIMVADAVAGDYFEQRWQGSSTDNLEPIRTFLSAVRVGSRP